MAIAPWSQASQWMPTEAGIYEPRYNWDSLQRDFDENHPNLMRELRADVAERGILTPLEVTPDGRVLRGHHRWLVARELGLAAVPVIYTSDYLPEHTYWDPETRQEVPYDD